MLRDDDGRAVGGLWRHLYYDWLFIAWLFVPESIRGQRFGTRLLARAEAVAREKGCLGVWVDSYSFQAPGSEARVRNVGHAGEPPTRATHAGHRRVFLRKRTADPVKP
jgi:GNAT superfamily N-acetyltransferase